MIWPKCESVDSTERTVATSVELSGYEDDAAFFAFVKSNLDPRRYNKIYRDVAATGADPVEHWLNHGLYEGRSMGEGALVVRARKPRRAMGNNWRRFVWRGDYIAVRLAPLSPSARKQIIDQATHDPAVLPPSALSFDCLHYVYRPELLNRDGLDVESILAALSVRPKTVILLPSLMACERARFATDLTDVLLTKKGGPVLVLVTEQSSEQAAGWEKLAIFSPFRFANVVFWRDICGRSHADPRMLAILLNVLRPRHIIVIESYLALETVACYGKRLSQIARLYCLALSDSNDEVTTVAMKFIRRVLPFAVVLTDSELTAGKLRDLYRGLPGPGIAVLPRRHVPSSEETFAMRLIARRQRLRSGANHARWAWVLRSEPPNGAAIVTLLAASRGHERFEIFSSPELGLKDLGLESPNIVFRGSVRDGVTCGFADYDGCIIVGIPEVMPNVVLEISQHAVPMILVDDGDGTALNGSAVISVRHGFNAADTAAHLACALDRLVIMSVDEVSAMIQEARAQALSGHALEMHERGVARIFHPI